jgi:alpha-tubulin suppressor-like RCC1 family protein
MAVMAVVVIAAALGPVGPAEAGGDPRLVAVTQVDIGGNHACARTDAGRVRCWGRNDDGQLGLGSMSDTPVPTLVRAPAGPGPLSGVRSVAVGSEQTCAVLTNGQARCWGANGQGQLGDGTVTTRLRPVVVRATNGVGPLTGVVRIAMGNQHTCAVLTNGQARCWGDNVFRQLGTGNTQDSRLPKPVRTVAGLGALAGVVAIDAGESHTCAVLRTTQARCWGQAGDGQAGVPNPPQFAARPLQVRNGAGTGPLVGVRSIAVGVQHTCATLTNGQARCWGLDQLGQLGNGPAGPSLLPVKVLDVDGVGPLIGTLQAAAGRNHTCVNLATRQVRCWGDGFSGQLGNGVTGASTLPDETLNTVASGPLVGVTQLGSGPDHTCARLTNGQARCWGTNTYSELGNRLTGTETHAVPVLA